MNRLAPEANTLAARLAMSPGWAMARQAGQNINALRQGTQMGPSPAQAYQQSVMNQALLRQREQEEQFRQQRLNPFFEYEQALERGLIPEGTTLQDYNRLYSRGAGSGQTIDERNLATYRRLLEEDPDMAERFAMAANFNLEKRGSPSLSSTDAAALSEANTATRTARTQAHRLNNLAAQFEAADIDAGVAGSVEDWFKRMTGAEDWESELRRMQREIINSDVINSLPPGVASDRDIQIAREGYPTNFANKEYVANYFRTLARLRMVDADYDRFKADFISEKGNQRGLNKAWERYAEEQYGGGTSDEPDDFEGWSIERTD